MDCIFLNRPSSNLQYCHAQPIRVGEDVQFYKPTKDELKKLCENPNDFCDCPRYEAMKDFVNKTSIRY